MYSQVRWASSQYLNRDWVFSDPWETWPWQVDDGSNRTGLNDFKIPANRPWKVFAARRK